jgi:hypothetical protein
VFTLNFRRSRTSPGKRRGGQVDGDEPRLSVAPGGAVAPGASAEDDLVVQRRDGRADERTDPEDPLHGEQNG